MARNPTWYSIKNQLTAGNVKASNTLERLLTVIVTSYGCIDIWYQQSEDNSNEIDIEIFYLQKDSTFTAAALGRDLESYERNQERPKFWLQFKGTVNEIRATLISLLPRLSQLHDQKRHGEWNFGATQPFEGQGSIVTRVEVSSGVFKTVITGRFGDILLSSNGEELNWDDITWSFDGCAPTATGPDSDQVCFKDIRSPIYNCQDTVTPVGTCAKGSCGSGWTITYPVTEAGCVTSADNPVKAWFGGQDLSDPEIYPQSYWDNYFNCEEPTGTCVVGSCSSGFTTGAANGTTEAVCNGLGGTWFGSNIVPGDLSAYFGCDVGCCVLGSGCNFEVHSGITSAQCDAKLAASQFTSKTFTAGQTSETCNRDSIFKARNCDDEDDGVDNPPPTITVTIEYKYTGGHHVCPGNVAYGFPGEPSPDAGMAFRHTGSGSDEMIPAITPGSAFVAPDFLNSGGTDEPDAVREATANPLDPSCYNFKGGEFSFQDINDITRTYPHATFDLSVWTKAGSVTNGTKTYQYVFKLVEGGNDVFAEYRLDPGTVHTRPQMNIDYFTGTLRKKNYCAGFPGCEDSSYHAGCYALNRSEGLFIIQARPTVIDAGMSPSGTLTRNLTAEGNDYWYDGSVGGFQFLSYASSGQGSGGMDNFKRIDPPVDPIPCQNCPDVDPFCTTCWQATCPAWPPVFCGYGTIKRGIPTPTDSLPIGMNIRAPFKNESNAVQLWGRNLTPVVWNDYTAGPQDFVGTGLYYGLQVSANQTTMTIVES